MKPGFRVANAPTPWLVKLNWWSSPPEAFSLHVTSYCFGYAYMGICPLQRSHAQSDGNEWPSSVSDAFLGRDQRKKKEDRGNLEGGMGGGKRKEKKKAEAERNARHDPSAGQPFDSGSKGCGGGRKGVCFDA